VTHEAFTSLVLHTRMLNERAARRAITSKYWPENPTSEEHLNWMLGQAVHDHQYGNVENAHRRLGCVQGVLLCRGDIALSELEGLHP
jgi:hypothetical protein